MYTYIFFLISFSFFLLFLLLMFGTFVVFGFFLRQAAFLCLLLFSLTNNHPGIRPVLAHLTGPRRGGGRTVGCVGRSGADLLTSACAPGRQNKAGLIRAHSYVEIRNSHTAICAIGSSTLWVVRPLEVRRDPPPSPWSGGFLSSAGIVSLPTGIAWSGDAPVVMPIPAP